MLTALNNRFFKQPTIILAKRLLGKLLVHKTLAGVTCGRICEVEAYISGDEANHAFRGPTNRNRTMFDNPGVAYIYRIYGKYHCLNVVAAPKGVGEAVLIRCLEPLEGIPLMINRRKTSKRDRLCNGPGKLVIAMGIEVHLNGHDLRRPPLYLSNDGLLVPEEQIKTSNRVGISKAIDLPFRFSISHLVAH